MSSGFIDKCIKVIIKGHIVIMSALFILLVISSLRWEFEHDTPLLHYGGLLMVKFGLVPYRDFFETSMPGVFALHATIINLFGPGNLAFQLVDLGFLALVLLASWSFLSCLDRTVATVFLPWYGFVYLAAGPAMILQRDGLVVLPVVTAMALVATRRPRVPIARAATCGLLFGVVAMVKPQLAMGAPVVIFADVLLDGIACGKGVRRFSLSSLLSFVVAWSVGFFVPISVALVWLHVHGALQPFLTMIIEYLPLHIAQTGDHVFLPPGERWGYILLQGLRIGGFYPVVPFATLAAVAAQLVLRDAKEKVVLAAMPPLLAAIYALCPLVSGQFWAYHYMPFSFFLVMTLSLLPLSMRNVTAFPRLALASGSSLMLAVFLLFVRIHPSLAQIEGHSEAKGGRVARMVTAIAANLRPGESVQPLDWTDGVIHAMLRLELRLPTSFFYDYHFYHNVDSPVIQGLRRRFLSEMTWNRPTLLVEATRNRPYVSGVGTATSFPEFEHLVSQDYRVIYEEPDFRILRRIGT